MQPYLSSSAQLLHRSPDALIVMLVYEARGKIAFKGNYQVSKLQYDNGDEMELNMTILQSMTGD